MEHRWILFVRAAIVASAIVAVPGTVMAQGNFDITATGQSSYIINGANDPLLTLTRGETYTFNVQVSSHPFWITTAIGADDVQANQWSLGVTNNGASPGTVTFVVPETAPATLFYQCGFHEPMNGQLNIVSPAQDVPWGGPEFQAALIAILLVVGLVSLRRTAA